MAELSKDSAGNSSPEARLEYLKSRGVEVETVEDRKKAKSEVVGIAEIVKQLQRKVDDGEVIEGTEVSDDERRLATTNGGIQWNSGNLYKDGSSVKLLVHAFDEGSEHCEGDSGEIPFPMAEQYYFRSASRASVFLPSSRHLVRFLAFFHDPFSSPPHTPSPSPPVRLNPTRYLQTNPFRLPPSPAHRRR